MIYPLKTKCGQVKVMLLEIFGSAFGFGDLVPQRKVSDTGLLR